MGVAVSILQALWFIWPAYTANAFPTLLKGKVPLDGGRMFGKNRLLGKSKTVEGTVGGILFGIFIGIIQMNILQSMPPQWELFNFTLSEIILLSIGALTGDIIGSFIKRRLDMKPGKPALLLDQLGFLLAALALVSFVFVPEMEMIIVLVVLTPAIHLLTNIVGYMLKLKKDPW